VDEAAEQQLRFGASAVVVVLGGMLLAGSASAVDCPHCPEELGFPAGLPQAGSCATDWCGECSTLLTTPPYNGYFPAVVQSRAVVQAVDTEIGFLLSALDLDDTAVILTSDNGSESRATLPPFSTAKVKSTVYQGGVNVPLVVRAPGGLSGDCHELVSLTDLYATVADLASVPLPPDSLRDSVSLTQYVDPTHTLSAPLPRSHVYAEKFSPNFVANEQGEPPLDYVAGFHDRALRSATHKLIEKRWWDAASGTILSQVEFYELASIPPQDPALGPDPHEDFDLMPHMESWTPATLDAYKELRQLMDVAYPALPIGPEGKSS